ncbi:MAG: RNA-directed DNA polymerase [Chloroflexi bacterium]|nr:RNA-directed DNA polymerase [Chloroflexota bacterium]
MSAVTILTHWARRLFVPRAPADDMVSDDVWRLGGLLEVSPTALLGFGAPRRPEGRYHYRPFRRAKRDGSQRRIYAPSPDLKALQRSLLRGYLDQLPVHPAATGFRRGMSVADNARQHLGQAVVVTADITDFFDNTRARRVENFFQAQSWDGTAASILTGLCIFRGALPQGAPTSPALSNLVNVPLDETLATFIRRSGGTYTRYGDDITFSWAVGDVPSGVEAKVRSELMAYDYWLNPAKGWRVWRARRGDTPCITGIMLGRDGRLHPNSRIKREMARLRRQRKDPVAAAQLCGYEGFVQSLRE